MPSDQDTVQTTETGQEVNGSQGGEQSTVVSEDPKPTEPQVDPEKEALRTELNKIKQRANQLENEREKDRKAKLEEEARWQELYEEERRKNQEREALEAEQARLNEAYELRNQAIEEIQDPRVKQIAKAAVAKNPNNFMWAGELDPDEAKTYVREQLEAFGPLVSSDTDEDKTTVSGNNGLPEAEPSEEPTDIQTRIARMKEAEKRLAGYKF